MEENNDKFIIGDNTDGYRRSTADYDLDLFAERKKPADEPKAEAPAEKQVHAKSRKNQQDKVKKTAKAPNFFSRKPSQPVPEKNGPTVKRHGKSPLSAVAKKKAQHDNNSVPHAEELLLSENERRRLHAERRRAERRRRMILQYVAIGVAVVGVMVALSLTVFFKIDEIEITGDSPYTDQEIIAASGVDFNENIIMCDARGVSEKLSKALPYIGSAEVKRSLSGKLTITVTVTPGQYAFANGETAVVINAEGKVLGQVTAKEAEKFTVVKGVSVVKATPGEPVELNDMGAFDLLKSFGAQLDAAGIDKITSIDISDVYNISCVYDGRLTLLVGGMGSVERKLALAAEVIKRENQVDSEQHGIIKLDSVDGKAFFQPVEEPTEEKTEEGETSDNGALNQENTTTEAETGKTE